MTVSPPEYGRHEIEANNTEVSILYYDGRNCMLTVDASVIERGVRYIVRGLSKVGILRPIEQSNTLKYSYFWAERIY